MAELANGYPIFPGESEVEQMQCLMEVLGLPPKAMLDRGPRKKIFFDSLNTPRLVPNSRGRVRRPNSKDLKAFLKTQDECFVDFVRGLLIWEPEKRLTPMQALQHPWMQDECDSSTVSSARSSAAPKVVKASVPQVGHGTGILPMLPKRNHWMQH